MNNMKDKSGNSDSNSLDNSGKINREIKLDIINKTTDNPIKNQGDNKNERNEQERIIQTNKNKNDKTNLNEYKEESIPLVPRKSSNDLIKFDKIKDYI